MMLYQKALTGVLAGAVFGGVLRFGYDGGVRPEP